MKAACITRRPRYGPLRPGQPLEIPAQGWSERGEQQAIGPQAARCAGAGVFEEPNPARFVRSRAGVGPCA